MVLVYTGRFRCNPLKNMAFTRVYKMVYNKLTLAVPYPTLGLPSVIYGLTFLKKIPGLSCTGARLA